MVLSGLQSSLAFVFVLYMFFADLQDSIAEGCARDEHCKPHQVCCGKRCRSWPKCFLNSDKECYYDTHCIKGAVCVSNVCKPQKLVPKSCGNDGDCVFQKHSRSFDGIVDTRKCCHGKCFKTKSCLALKINSSLTTPTTSQTVDESCSETTDCASGHECVNARCTVNQVLDSSKESQQHDTTLSRAGFLSAAILTAAVFLTVMCFCFLKETKYARRQYLHRTERGESLTQSTCSSQVDNSSVVLQDHAHSLNSRNSSRAFRITTSWILFAGLHGLSQTERRTEDSNCDRQEDVNSTCTGPPSYRSVCFDQELPPSYAEAMHCQCQNCPHNIATAESDSQTDQ